MAESYSEADKKYTARTWIGYYDSDPVIVRGEGALVFSEDGKKYIDCMAAAQSMNVGHCHPRVVKAIREQAGKIIHSSIIGRANVPQIELAETLSDLARKHGFDNLRKVWFTTGGSEAVEFAMIAARSFTNKSGILSERNSYHGSTLGSLSVTGVGFFKSGVGPLPNNVWFTPSPYCYRCSYRGLGSDCCLKSIKAIETVIEHDVSAKPAAIIIEPFQHIFGIIPPQEYFDYVAQMCRKYDMLLIVDEVLSAFCRTGKMFASEHWGIRGNLMALGKALGGGMPIGATLCEKDIVERLQFHTMSQSGNAVSCAASLAAIEAMIDEKMDESSRRMGERLRKGYEGLAEEHHLIGDVRMIGLAGGIELVKNRDTKEPAIEECYEITKRLRDYGVLMGKSWNVMRPTPPLTITEEQVDTIIEATERALRDVESK